ncbi:MAG: hypothetical protein JO121_14340 [Deltaproteobacteria bacterium]|nr:hypothetical protein [Deltaproteobacteria bacterium]
MAVTLSSGIAGAGRFLRREFVAVWPVFVFFLTGFLLLLVLVKLALAQFSIEVKALSNALVGALIAAKAALVLDETPLARSLERYRRIVAVAVKTLFYGIVSLAMGYLERFLEAFHKVRHFDQAFREVVQHANHNRLLGWALGISIVFALYFSHVEISLRMGEGELTRLFFESPAASNRSPTEVTNAFR